MSFNINVFAILTIHSRLFDIFFLRRSPSFYFRYSTRSTFSFLTKVGLTVRAEWIISHHKSIFNLIAELDDVISLPNYHNTFEGFFYHSGSPMKLVITWAYHGNNSWFAGIPLGRHSPAVVPLPLPLSFQIALNLPEYSLSLDYESEATGFLFAPSRQIGFREERTSDPDSFTQLALWHP